MFGMVAYVRDKSEVTVTDEGVTAHHLRLVKASGVQRTQQSARAPMEETVNFDLSCFLLREDLEFRNRQITEEDLCPLLRAASLGFWNVAYSEIDGPG